jgi:subtilisin family serine protease
VNSVTRQPRILVKIPRTGPAQRASLSFGKATVDFTLEPLFQSIRPASGPGIAAPAEWHLLSSPAAAGEVNAWDLCHHITQNGLGIAGTGPAEFAEPDVQQQWAFGTSAQHAMALADACTAPAPPDPTLPDGNGIYWFRDDQHSQLQTAHGPGPGPSGIRIAHLDTGYDPDHVTLPQFLRRDLQRNFVDDKLPNDATDRSTGFANNLGHGTGTLSILAGNTFDGAPLGGAPFMDVIPVRVANSVVLFFNSGVARGFDYVHELASNQAQFVHVVTMSMGGLASRAWADAVNALYELGIFVVTAAGNNFGNLPSHNIVFPARFKRVVAACGVMADGRPYADLPLKTMAGDYGPASKMTTAMAAYTPNTPWARLGCSSLVDHNGRGTSATTPQIAAAAALWIQKYKTQWDAYSQPWMRVEAIRQALFSLDTPDEHLGRGVLRAADALAKAPAMEAQLAGRKQPVDSADFPFLRVITGLGVAPGAGQQMLELEALQLSQQSHELEQLLPDPEADPSTIPASTRNQIIEALVAMPGASQALKSALGTHLVKTSAPKVAMGAALTAIEQRNLRNAIEPPIPTPSIRRLRVFAYDPLAATKVQTAGINETVLEIRWEKNLEPGPVGDYVEVVDVDPASDCCYAPADLNHPTPLSQCGFAPSESNPRFHQQMAYAVSMKTIEYFEHALGRVALWAERLVKSGNGYEHHYVPRLRIYPHAMREANSYYSPDKKALLLGYFQAQDTNPGENLPGGTVFCCLSHDIVAHETTHALLDGLHPRFREASNPDVLAFHEAFADIVALFQHFSVPEALRDQIGKTRGDLGAENMLGQLAQQFGQGIGKYGALRDAIGGVNEKGDWAPAQPSPTDYQSVTEPHDRGSILVAAVFDAFLTIYRRRSEDLIRLATSGTGILPQGAIPHDLVTRLAAEASKSATHVLNICIRALDYCPPFDLTFGEYLRGLITADRDLVPDDTHAYRIAFIEAFRRRGIYPEFVRNLSVESLCWAAPEVDCNLESIVKKMSVAWDLRADRRQAWDRSRTNAFQFHKLLLGSTDISDADAATLGFSRAEKSVVSVAGKKGVISKFEVHSVRPVRRVGPDGQQVMDLLVEITQTWRPKDGPADSGSPFRGGCTMLIDLATSRIRYCIRKRVANPERIAAQQSYQNGMAASSLRANYFSNPAFGREPFAMLHRGA